MRKYLTAGKTNPAKTAAASTRALPLKNRVKNYAKHSPTNHKKDQKRDFSLRSK
jgi:hypothetical protein